MIENLIYGGQIMSKNQFKIATFNLYNLVLADHIYYGNQKYSQEEYDKKKMWIEQQLLNMDANIIGFQEVFHREALEEILSNIPKYKKTVEENNLIVVDGGGQNPSVGLVSTFPILEYQIIEEYPDDAKLIHIIENYRTEFYRPVIKARIKLNDNLDCWVFVTHLKSKRPKFRKNADMDDLLERAIGEVNSLMLRASGSVALRSALIRTMKENDTPVIVLGDLNDNGNAVTSQIISGTPPFYNAKIEEKEKVWDVLLYNVKDIQARQSERDVSYTHIYNGHYDNLDSILISQEFYVKNPDKIGIVKYVKVYNDHLIDQTLSTDKIPRWQSDHGQVVATLELKK